MKIALLAIASLLSVMAYFVVNLVMCTACMIPGCGVASVGISFFVLLGTWAFLLFTDSGLE